MVNFTYCSKIGKRNNRRDVKKYYFYVLRCSDNSLYCGMTTDLEKRVKEHGFGSRGAKYLRGKKPVKLIYSEEYSDIKTAMGRELEVKSWTKVKKEALVARPIVEGDV